MEMLSGLITAYSSILQLMDMVEKLDLDAQLSTIRGFANTRISELEKQFEEELAYLEGVHG